MVEFAINSSVNATTGYAPFELNHGSMLQSGQHILTDTVFKGVLHGDLLKADNGVAKSDGSGDGGTWLQLMCCTLPKCLCP